MKREPAFCGAWNHLFVVRFNNYSLKTFKGPPRLYRHIRRYSTIFDNIRRYATLFDIIRHYIRHFFDIRHHLTLFNIFDIFRHVRQHSTVANCRTVPKFVKKCRMMSNDASLGVVVPYCGSLRVVMGHWETF